jgi:hypothetical protein
MHCSRSLSSPEVPADHHLRWLRKGLRCSRVCRPLCVACSSLSTNPQGSSAIGIRTGRSDPERSREPRPSYAAFEVQLLDGPGSPPSPHGTGSLYRYKSPTANPARPAPEMEHDRGRLHPPPDHGSAQRSDVPESQPVRARGREDQAGGGASSKGQASHGVRGTSEPQRPDRIPEGADSRVVIHCKAMTPVPFPFPRCYSRCS